MKGNFLTSGRPIETICNTIESSGTLWISGVENFSNALKSASEKNLQQTPETDGNFLNNTYMYYTGSHMKLVLIHDAFFNYGSTYF